MHTLFQHANIRFAQEKMVVVFYATSVALPFANTFIHVRLTFNLTVNLTNYFTLFDFWYFSKKVIYFKIRFYSSRAFYQDFCSSY